MRVVIAEDNALLREGLVLLPTSAGHEVAAVAGAEPEILPALRVHRPDGRGILEQSGAQTVRRPSGVGGHPVRRRSRRAG